MRLRNIPRADKVLENSPFVIKSESSYRGKWAHEVFRNENPIHIEIGMGKGQFLLTLAEQNPDINYIGIERYSSVLLRAVEKLTPDAKIPNLRFICMDAAGLGEVFAPQEISRMYLNFSDPWPKKRHAHRRLTSSEYLKRYDQILKSGGLIEFKTDNKDLFEFSEETLGASYIWEVAAITRDLHRDAVMNTGNIMTEYEEKFSSMNHPIYKLIAKRQANRLSCI